MVAWNVASDNPGGCGVILAGHSTAGVTDNLVAHNVLTHNGTFKSTGGGAGVVIPIDLATSSSSKKNVAVPDARTTGILVGSASSIHVLISGNRIARNHFGIFLEGVGSPVHATLHGNQFHRVHKPVKRVIVH